MKATKKVKRNTKPEKDKYLAYLEDVLTDRFSSKVNIKSNKNKGKIEIEYHSSEDLNRILDLLKIED